ncbi:MAG: hypothetical protein MI863_10275 [Desulfobacterales bacterium]|nr:hypothetical protein [Desulfobacterales bacterium]
MGNGGFSFDGCRADRQQVDEGSSAGCCGKPGRAKALVCTATALENRPDRVPTEWAGQGQGGRGGLDDNELISILLLSSLYQRRMTINTLTGVKAVLYSEAAKNSSTLPVLRCNAARKGVLYSKGINNFCTLPCEPYALNLPVPVTAGTYLEYVSTGWAFSVSRPISLKAKNSRSEIMSEMNRILARVRRDARCSSCPLINSIPVKQAEFCAITAIILSGAGQGLSETEVDSMLEIYFEAREIFIPEEVNDA